MEKVIAALVLIALYSIANAQDTTSYIVYDTIFYDAEQQITTADNFSRYQVRFRSTTDTNNVRIVEYYESGQIKLEHIYSNYYYTNRAYKSKEWYESGQLHQEEKYLSGLQHGKHLVFWENGNKKREDIYSNGKLIIKKCFGIDGLDTTYYDYQTAPEFPGELEAMMQYLVDNIKYPEKVRRAGIEGKIVIRFFINTDGSLEDFAVIKSSGNDLLDAEALRVAKAMPDWKPALFEGKPVKLRMTLPIVFKLE